MIWGKHLDNQIELIWLTPHSKTVMNLTHTYSLFTVTSHSSKPLTVTVEINSTTLNMEVDTGASPSLVSEATYNQLKLRLIYPLCSQQLQNFTPTQGSKF